ncbi:MAG: AAA family ATPase [Lachnospiraceae bacterium]|nr:AAA family ATPase [Lachnospiraceae bacterium]
MSESTITGSLNTLSRLLEKHYGRKVIILIDEYDVPLAKANEHGYYDKMIVLIRNMLDAALKTNDSLFFSVMTGCLRVSKESIFTGLNNLKIYSLLDAECDEQFGFTDAEVREIWFVLKFQTTKSEKSSANLFWTYLKKKWQKTAL